MTDTTARPFAVVTGGSNGIGFELARRFVEMGHEVLTAAQDAGHLTEAAGRRSSDGAQVTPHAAPWPPGTPIADPGRADKSAMDMTDTTARPFAVVTGGSNGIGFELARRFVEMGHEVLTAAQDAGHLTEAAGRRSSDGVQVTPHAADLSREDGVDSLVRAIGAAERPMDVLCVNAGVGLEDAFVETDLRAVPGHIGSRASYPAAAR